MALSTIYLIVLSTLIVRSLIDKGPVIFLNLSQINNGEIDVYLSPKDPQMFVNFTAIKNVIKNESFKVSPRKVMSGTILESYNEDEEVIKRMQREV